MTQDIQVAGPLSFARKSFPALLRTMCTEKAPDFMAITELLGVYQICFGVLPAHEGWVHGDTDTPKQQVKVTQ